MKNIWVSTDWHLYNEEGGDIRHPFKTERVIQAIEDTFVKMIDDSDLFIFLGDLCDADAMTDQQMKRVVDLIHRIPGTKVMCRGNHDTLTDEEYRIMGFDYVTDICRVHHMIFSHHPVRIAPDEINIHGHLHTDKYSAIELGHYQYVNAYGIRDEKTKSPYPILVEDLLDKVIEQHNDPEPDWGKKFESGFAQYTDLITCLNTTDDRILDLSNEILLIPEEDEPINESIGTSMVSLSASTEEDEKEDHSDDEILDEILFQDVDQTKYWEADDDSYQKHLDGAQYSDDRPTSKAHGKNDVIAERDPYINEAATAMKPPKIDETLEEILLLNNRLNQMKYGLHMNTGIKGDFSSEEFSKQYHVASPSEFLERDGGVCWDFATYEDSYFITHFPNMKYKTWYIVFDDGQYYPTHTFLTFQYNGYHFYFESSFLSLQGVWYSKKEADLINFVLDGMNRHDSLHPKKPLIQYPYHVFQYDAGHRDIPGMDTKEFMDFVERTGKRRRHKFTHNFRVNQLQFMINEAYEQAICNESAKRSNIITTMESQRVGSRYITTMSTLRLLGYDPAGHPIARPLNAVSSVATDILDGMIRIAPEEVSKSDLAVIKNSDMLVDYAINMEKKWKEINQGYSDMVNFQIRAFMDTKNLENGAKFAFPKLIPFVYNDAQFRQFIDARIDELDQVEDLLSEALLLNLAAFTASAEKGIVELKEQSKKVQIGTLKAFLDKFADKYTKIYPDGSRCIDYSAIEYGKTLISKSVYDEIGETVLSKPSRYLSRMVMYDVIVISHGGVDQNDKWTMDPVTYNGKSYTDVYKLLDKIAVNGQQVLLMICNPGAVPIDAKKYQNVDYVNTNSILESVSVAASDYQVYDKDASTISILKEWKSYIKHQIKQVGKVGKQVSKVLNTADVYAVPNLISVIYPTDGVKLERHDLKTFRKEGVFRSTYSRACELLIHKYEMSLFQSYGFAEACISLCKNQGKVPKSGYLLESYHNISTCKVLAETTTDPFESMAHHMNEMMDRRRFFTTEPEHFVKGTRALIESLEEVYSAVDAHFAATGYDPDVDYVIKQVDDGVASTYQTLRSSDLIKRQIGTEPDQPEVYFTSQITPDALVDIYHRTGFHGTDALVKISSGEPGKGPRYCLDPDLIGLLLYHIHGTIGECNVGYEGPRYQTETHLKVLKDHGYTEIAPCDILDSAGEISLPVENGYHLKEFVVGSHLQDYGTIIVLSHFKGHPMAGFGGALKNVAIGFASSDGKKLVHSGGTTTSYIAGMGETNDPANIQEIFLQSMADGNAAFQAWAKKLGAKVLYINIANNISVDCDCVVEPEAPTMRDIGIFASYDPVAVDQACIDFVYGASDSQHVIERIEERHGSDLLEYAAEKNIGSRNYKLVTIDEMNEAATFRQVKKIVDHIPKEEHHWFYHGDSFKDSPYMKYRDVMYTPDKKHAGFIDVYAFDSDPDTGIVVIALEPEARGTGIATKLVQKAIQKLPSLGIKKLIWRADTDNTASIKLAQKLGFHDISDLKANPDQYKYEYLLNESSLKEYKRTDDNGQLSREEKKKIADKYGLRAVGQVSADEEEERRKTPEQRLEEKRKKQLSTLKKARKVKKRKAMVRKIKSHLPFKSQNEDTAVDDTDVPGMEVEDNPLYGQRKHFFYNYDMPKPENTAAERLSEMAYEDYCDHFYMKLKSLANEYNKRDDIFRHIAKVLKVDQGKLPKFDCHVEVSGEKQLCFSMINPDTPFEIKCEYEKYLKEMIAELEKDKEVKSEYPYVTSIWTADAEGSIYINLDHENMNEAAIKINDMTRIIALNDESMNIKESYQFELLDKNVHFYDKMDETASYQTKGKLYPVYVMLVHSGTTVSNVIKTVSKSEYSHASISFDSSMRQMYSFARKDPNNPFIGGFRYETIGEGFYEKKEIPYAVYVVPCTESQIKKMKKRLAYFEKNKENFTFDFTGLVTNYLGIVNNPAHRWFCSRFVADILNAGSKKSDPYVAEPSLMDPDDFKHTTFAYYVTSGKNLMKYDQKKVDRLTTKILREEKMRRMALQENVIFNLDFNDPYTEAVIGYQLAMMDESVVDQFFDYLKSFHVRLDKDGNVILTRRVYTELDHHFRQTQKMLKMEKKSGDIEGMKTNLAKLYYMIGLIDEQYLKNRTVSRSNTVRKDMVDLRSVMMNAFQQYLKYLEELDPSFNFQSYYDSSIYGKETKIPLSAVTAIGKSLKTLL